MLQYANVIDVIHFHDGIEELFSILLCVNTVPWMFTATLSRGQRLDDWIVQHTYKALC